MASPEVPQHHNPKTLSLKPSSSSASSMSTLSSVLTEERLREHNRRPPSAASPYYRGLTDSGLYLRSLGLSPGRESVASSARSSSSSSSSVLLMIQEWGSSCFSRSNIKKKEVDGGELQRARPLAVAAWDPGLPAVTEAAPRGGGSGSRRPLRESEQVLVPAPVQQPAVAARVVNAPTQQHVPPPTVSIRGEVRKEREFVWVYKYRPRHLKEFICNKDQVEELQEMVRKQQCSHLIVEGPPGVGKRTMVLAFLQDALGPENLKTKNELRKIELKGEHISSIDFNVRASSQHVEVNLSELRGYEKHILVSLINESRVPADKSVQCDHSNCRAIVVHEADRLSTDAQHYVRWLMEKYKGCNKIFFCCSDASKLQAIKNLCKIVKLQQPSDVEIVDVLEFIAKKERIELSRYLADKIAKKSKHNLRQAIRSFEASWKANHSFKDDNNILTGWEDDIANIAKSIVKEQSPKQLYMIRGKLKKLIEHDVSPDFIFNNLIFELKKLLDKQFHDKINAMYQEYRIHDSGPPVSPEKLAASSLDRHEDSGDKSHDQRINVHYFMRIEALWWESYGDECKELQVLAIGILSLTCSATGYERNWSVFDYLHSKRRNRLEQLKLNALVFVKYNLQLEMRQKMREAKGDTYDPICLSDMDSDDEWITEKEGACLPDDNTWMDIEEYFELEEGTSGPKKKKGKKREFTAKFMSYYKSFIIKSIGASG